EERDTFFKDRTDAQDSYRPCYKYLVFWESVFDTIILEHYPLFLGVSLSLVIHNVPMSQNSFDTPQNLCYPKLGLLLN
ncbi:MAG: hypothetical protein LBL76_02970, partial [Treponema sp.]|nr:hypothetical protein [Treponema sp.]